MSSYYQNKLRLPVDTASLGPLFTQTNIPFFCYCSGEGYIPDSLQAEIDALVEEEKQRVHTVMDGMQPSKGRGKRAKLDRPLEAFYKESIRPFYNMVCLASRQHTTFPSLCLGVYCLDHVSPSHCRYVVSHSSFPFSIVRVIVASTKWLDSCLRLGTWRYSNHTKTTGTASLLPLLGR